MKELQGENIEQKDSGKKWNTPSINEKILKRIALIFGLFFVLLVILDIPSFWSGDIKMMKYLIIKCFIAMLLIGCYAGTNIKNITNWLTFFLIFILFFAFIHKTPKEVSSIILNPKSQTAIQLPRDVGWMTWNVKKVPTKLCRIYEGDQFEYISPSGFWIFEKKGKKIINSFYHNPSAKPGEVRSFPFYDIPPQGEVIFIKGNNNFQLQYRLKNKR